MAREIHKKSNRGDKPYIKINCAAIPESLIESELFGYEQGAFTGAQNKGKVGMFEAANGGTILLDEIGEMPIALQSKLLRVLQERELTRIGGTKSIKLDIRVIAATNQNLEEIVKKKLFRQDLYYRLNVIPIIIPPLRNRKEDIVLLAHSFLEKYNIKYDKNLVLDNRIVGLLEQYNWPGNVRQLQNTIERCLNLVDDGEVITLEHIPREIKNYSLLDDINSLDEEKDNIERSTIYKALLVYNNNKSLVARKLGISRVTLYEKIKKYNIKI